MGRSEELSKTMKIRVVPARVHHIERRPKLEGLHKLGVFYD